MGLTKKAVLSFETLVKSYAAMQSNMVSRLQSLSQSIETASPGEFLLAQFSMAQVSQIGDSISNLIAQGNKICNTSVQNQLR